MLIYTLKFDKKKAVFWVLMTALVIVAVILLAGARDQRSGTEQVKSARPITNVKSEKQRVAYLAQYGWEVESPALSEENVVIPRIFNQVFENYNALQKQQGFDLSDYCGMEVKLYTYKVCNSSIGDEVVAMLYVYSGTVIAGDVHSTALDGYMCGIKQ